MAHASARWRRRTGAARLVRFLVVAIPVLLGRVASLVAVALLPAAEKPLAVVLWWVVVVGVALLTARLAERVTRRALPLELLLRMSLRFPRSAPSRLRVAMLANSSSMLAQRVAASRDNGFGGSRVEAAKLLLSLLASLARHDPATRGHTERVRAYTDLMAAELDLDEDDAGRLRWAALLHDIGKVHVAAAVLNKPAELDEEEWDAVRRHPFDGALLAAPVLDWLGEWGLAVAQHHEHWDGTGYPLGLAGTDISTGGRIVAVTDAYEVMTAPRPYKASLSGADARRELVDCAGTHFDPAMVRAFLAVPIPRLRRLVSPIAGLLPLAVFDPVRQAAQRLATSGVVAAGLLALALGGVVGPGDEGPGRPGETPAAAGTTGPGAGAAGSGDSPGATPSPTGTPRPSTSVLSVKEGNPAGASPTAAASAAVRTPAPTSTGAVSSAPSRRPGAPTAPAPTGAAAAAPAAGSPGGSPAAAPPVRPTTTTPPTPSGPAPEWSSLLLGWSAGGGVLVTAGEASASGDVDGDGRAGLTVRAGPGGAADPSAAVFRRPMARDTRLEGRLALTLWASPHTSANRPGVHAWLLDCSGACTVLADRRSVLAGASEPPAYVPTTVDLGRVDAVVPAGHELRLVVAVLDRGLAGDVSLAVGDPAAPSRLGVLADRRSITALEG
jgi:HD-GYP domain-containing protein (c-di-GMP phosphodiesterase class II)